MINHYIPTSVCLAKIKIQLILLFSLFLLLFINLTALFGTIHKSYCTISANFYFIYSTFNKKFLILAKQTDLK